MMRPPIVHGLTRGLSITAALTAVLVACSGTPHDALFPLEAGHRWVYEVKTEWEGAAPDTDTQVFTTLGSESVDGLEGGAAWHRRSDSGVDYWLRSDETGIYRVATKSDVDAEPKIDKPPRPVLKAPIAVGTSWQNSTTAYLLRRRQEFPPEIKHTHAPVPMNYRIEAVGQALNTRVGRFERCVKVVGQAQMRLFADPVSGWKDMPLTTEEWYCPGPGLVRLTRSEPANSAFLGGGSLTMELTEWQ
jgi:hypothetical protein